MAVSPDQYLAKFKAKALYGLLAIELILIATSFGLVYILHENTELSVNALILSGFITFVSLQLITTQIIIDKITEPLKLLIEAITHLSQQSDGASPPTLNKNRHINSGLKELIGNLYELTSGNAHQLDIQAGNKDKLAHDGVFLEQLLSEVPCGIIALNKNRTIIYNNQFAPTWTDTKHELQIELNFDTDNSLALWLKKCEKEKVRDTKTWTGIENKPPGDPGHKVFDVIAYYQKESKAAETIVVTIDRTQNYAPIQEDIDFIALAAHELRGPITVIQGYIDVLSQEMAQKLMPDQKELFDRMSVSANRLTTYVNNVLNVSKHDRRHLKLHLHEYDLSNVFAGLVDDVAMRARTQNRILSIDIPPGIPTIAADNNSLGEVIINLIDNAIKYSQEGGQVVVKAEVKGDFVEVTVQDFGIGIPASLIGNMFTKFYRSHRTRQAVGGTGLGLYISKAIIESHGGKMWVNSTEGQGSTFGFSVPIYSTVAKKLLSGNNENQAIIESSSGWIKNHSMYRG